MRHLFLSIISSLIIFGPFLFAREVAAAGQTYTSIVDLPLPAGMRAGSDSITTEDFVRIMYSIAISIAAILAVVKIVYGGVQYMLTDIVTSKEQAKKDIRGALLGLLIVIGAVVLLNTINPQLTTLDALNNVEGVQVESFSGVSLDDAQIGENRTINPASKEAEHFQETCPGEVTKTKDNRGRTTFSCN